MAKKKETIKKKKKLVKKVIPRKVTKKKVVAKKVGTGKKQTKKSEKIPKKNVLIKKKAPKRTPKKPLVYASDWQVFYAVNGAVLHSMDDLYNELETMLEEEYLYHKNSGDNFTVWVREVLGDDSCAKDLSKASSRKKARVSLKKHLKKYVL
jgi:hypothetical protein